jgi:prepilin signal peptidase PulO-like enzyme (type II secretory pathway)
MTAILFAILGALLASFAGVVAGRLNTGQPWTHSRSRCDACAAPLGVADLVPVFSWLFRGGKCRACRARVLWLGPASELALAALFVVAYWTFGLTAALIPFLVALVILIALVLYDLAHTIVPPSLSALLAAAAAAFACLAAPSAAALLAAFLTAACIGAGFALIHFASRGRLMGLGDAPVAFSLSLLAAPRALTGLTLSFWIGGMVGIAILLSRPKGHRMGIEVPFVPFLAAGYILAALTTINLYPYL